MAKKINAFSTQKKSMGKKSEFSPLRCRLMKYNVNAQPKSYHVKIHDNSSKELPNQPATCRKQRLNIEMPSEIITAFRSSTPNHFVHLRAKNFFIQKYDYVKR
jgi:hypothetical protein